ncbi:hypothetical protein U1Q18_014874 [Sarracenia purpurea var. burkii]
MGRREEQSQGGKESHRPQQHLAIGDADQQRGSCYDARNHATIAAIQTREEERPEKEVRPVPMPAPGVIDDDERRERE